MKAPRGRTGISAVVFRRDDDEDAHRQVRPQEAHASCRVRYRDSSDSCPQQVMTREAEMVGSIDDLVRRGRQASVSP